MELKERKQELMSCCNVPHLPPGIPDLNVPLIEEEMEDDCVIVDSAQAFDLNVPHEVEVEEENIVRVEPTQMLDLDVPNKVCNKVMAAEARKRRMGIYRLKNLFATTRPRYPKPVYG